MFSKGSPKRFCSPEQRRKTAEDIGKKKDWQRIDSAKSKYMSSGIDCKSYRNSSNAAASDSEQKVSVSAQRSKKV